MSPIITGLMIFFSVTTVVVLLYPIIKLAPSWFERSVSRKAGLHRDSILALDMAIDRAGGDVEHRARLEAQRDYHRSALANLLPGDASLASPTPQRVDAAA
jgi:hypothetical protein